MNRLLLGALSGIAMIACRQTPESGSGRDGPIETADVTIELHPYFRDLRVVHARVGGDTLRLLLDTGGGATLITPQLSPVEGAAQMAIRAAVNPRPERGRRET